MHKRHFNEKRVKEEPARWGRLQFFKGESLSVTSEIRTSGFSALSFPTFLFLISEVMSDIEIQLIYLRPCNCLWTPHHLNGLHSGLKYRRPPLFSCFCVSHEVHCRDLPSWGVDSPRDRVPRCTHWAHYGPVMEALVGIIRFGAETNGPPWDPGKMKRRIPESRQSEMAGWNE